ncbi:hypothetical protein SAMN05421690_1002110 [Nitrosomonas sp. Nm51]|nr:hypothetical protein SAMN05421690_1002110 [Nitrosomonas sp. Nm51]
MPIIDNAFRQMVDEDSVHSIVIDMILPGSASLSVYMVRRALQAIVILIACQKTQRSRWMLTSPPTGRYRVTLQLRYSI